MKKFGALLLVVVLVIAGVIFVPELVHSCDDCGEVFVGTGYKPGVLSDLASDLLTGKEMEIICRSCAEKQHALGSLVGKDLDEYKRKLFE